jgi:hypothetical protein
MMAGKICFMAGATSGINLQIARRFAMEGAKVYVISRSLDKVTATIAELNELGAEAAGKNVDVRSYPDVEEAVTDCVETFGAIDMVLAGQAGNFVAGAAQMSANAFKSVVDIDLLGTFNIFRATAHQVKKPGANMIAITAPQATQAAVFQAHVCAAKAGVNMLVKCLAMEWGISGIRVNAISPGPIEETEGMDRLAPSEEMREKYKQALALKKFGTKDHIADAALWLCSPAAEYVTGHILEVEGGTTLGDASMAMKF